jgi:hypothetical protein
MTDAVGRAPPRSRSGVRIWASPVFGDAQVLAKSATTARGVVSLAELVLGAHRGLRRPTHELYSGEGCEGRWRGEEESADPIGAMGKDDGELASHASDESGVTFGAKRDERVELT